MTTTKIDAVALKRAGAHALAAQRAGMSPEQQQRFWEEQTNALRERQQAVRTAVPQHAAHHPPTDEVPVWHTWHGQYQRHHRRTQRQHHRSPQLTPLAIGSTMPVRRCPDDDDHA